MRPFVDGAEATAYVAEQLSRALPSGWRATLLAPLAWELRHEADNSDGFLLLLPTSLDFFIITHGNEAVGVWGLHHELQNAMVAPVEAMKDYELADCVTHVIAHCKPNVSSAT